MSGRQDEAGHFGRRTLPSGPELAADLFAEAADYVQVIRRLWDSWEDDAEIRDVATGRFVDRESCTTSTSPAAWFSVKGPSITPRPPQGQPVVTALAHLDVAYQLLAGSADLGFVDPARRRQRRADRGRDPGGRGGCGPRRRAGPACSPTCWSSWTTSRVGRRTGGRGSMTWRARP